MTETTLVPVRMGDCRCTGTPHADGDFAYLRPYLLFEGGLEASEALLGLARSGETSDMAYAKTLTPLYLRHGIVDWTLVDDDGEPVAVTPEAIAALPWDCAYFVGNKADDLYSEAVLRPLVARIGMSSPGTPTARSTSPRSASRRKRRSPSASPSMPGSAAS